MPRRTRPRTVSGAGILLARSALILVGNITYTEKRTRRAFVLPRSTQDIKDGSGRHVAYDARLQQILALVIAQGFKWKQVQGAVRRNDESWLLSSLRGSAPGVLGKDVSRFLPPRPLRVPHRQIAPLVSSISLRPIGNA